MLSFFRAGRYGHRKLAQWLVAASLADPTQPHHDLHVKDPWALAVLSIALLEKHVHVTCTVTCRCTAKTQGPTHEAHPSCSSWTALQPRKPAAPLPGPAKAKFIAMPDTQLCK